MPWIVAAVLMLLAALVFDLGLLAYVIYVLATVLLVSRFLTRQWADGLSAERTCDRLEAEVGDTVSISVALQNASPFPIPWCLAEDLLPRRALIHDPPSLAVVGRRVRLSMLGGGGRQSIEYRLTCNRRGYYQLGPLVLETGDLFGLHRRYRAAAKPHFLLVLPRVVPLGGYDVSSRRPIGEVKLTHRLYEDPTRIAGVRAYQAGDPLNRIHWRATARTGALHSKVYEPTCVAGLTVVMDLHTASHDPRHEPFRSELAVTAAASVVNAVYEMGQQTGLVTNGRDAADRIRAEGWDRDLRTRDAALGAAAMLDRSDRLRPVVVATRRGPEQRMRILQTLARIELTDGLTLPQLLLETTSRLPRDASVLVILPKVAPEDAIALLNLRRQGFAVGAMVNIHDNYEFSQAAGPLIAAGIEVFHLRDEAGIVDACRRIVLR